MQFNHSQFLWFIAFVLLVTPLKTFSDDMSRRYRTLEEKREAGQQHEITEWLLMTPLIESEYLSQNVRPYDQQDSTVNESNNTLQLDTDIKPTEWLKAEIVYEYDDLLDEFVQDEAFAEIAINDFKMELGKLYLPFGEYYSRFVTGPILEFGETRAGALVLSYEPGDDVETAVFVYESTLDQDPTTEGKLDWGISLNVSAVESVTTGFSYISDLSETDERLLEENIFYQKRVDAVSAYINIEFDNVETSIEWLQALDTFSELDTDRNKPSAWNLEVAYYPEEDYGVALRMEGSKELEDAPDLQAGIAVTVHAIKNITATAEFLRGNYKRGFAEGLDGNELDKVDQLAVQVGISF